MLFDMFNISSFAILSKLIPDINTVLLILLVFYLDLFRRNFDIKRKKLKNL